MSKVITSARFLELCTKWNIKYVPIHSNWASHNRAGHGEFGDMHGIGIHHTGSSAPTSAQNEILWNGTNLGTSNPLPGPLCHAGIDTSGILRLAGWGRANHFGLGSKSTLDHVIKEDYTGVLKPGPASIDGNAHFYGFEIMYSGDHVMTDAQRVTAVRVSAMLCTEHKWTELSTIGHGEWQQGKWDPGISRGKMMPMDKFRIEVKQAIKEGPVKPLPTRPKPATKQITVVKGDTLSSLANKYYPKNLVPLASLIKDNPQLIQPGDKLIVPNV